MNSIGNDTLQKMPLSPLLKAMLKDNQITADVAEWAEEFPTLELQDTALHRYRDERESLMDRIKAELLGRAPTLTAGSATLSQRENAHDADVGPLPMGGGTRRAGEVPASRWSRLKEFIVGLKSSSWARYGGITAGLWLAAIATPLLYQGLMLPVKWAWQRLSSPAAAGRGSMDATPQASARSVADSPSATETAADARQRFSGWAPTIRGDDSSKEAAPGETPIPRITSWNYTDGHKIVLHWTPIGAGYTYRIYRDCDPESSIPGPGLVDEGRTVDTPGATVNLIYNLGCAQPALRVMAIAPGNLPSDLSNAIQPKLNIANDRETVEPLAMEATTASPQFPSPLHRRERMPEGQVRVHSDVDVNVKGTRTLTPRPTPGGDLSRNNEGERVDEGQSAAVNQKPGTRNEKRGTANPKRSFAKSLTRHLLDNADGAIASVIPSYPVGEGVIATKNAVMSARDDTARTEVKGLRSEDASLSPQHSVLSPSVPAPTNLRGERVGHTVRMTWDTPGTEYRYNVYVAYYGDHPVFDTGNDAPVNGPVITWTPPPDGVQVFVLYIKAVDTQGREGPASNRIIADLR